MKTRETATQILTSALAYHKAGRLEEAERSYRKALSLDPNLVDALRLLGVLNRQRGDMECARTFLERASKLSPNSAEAHHDLGLVLFEQGEFDAAIAEYQRALNLNANFASAHHNLGNVYHAIWDLDNARACYECALQQEPDQSESNHGLSLVKAKLQQLESTAHSLKRRLRFPESENTGCPGSIELPHRNVFPYILNRLDLTGVGAEIGVCEGNFSEVILRNWKGESLYSIDPWREFPSDEYTDVNSTEQATQDDRYRLTIKRLRSYHPRSIIWRMTSKQAADLLSDDALDFVYIDGNHGYEAVTADLNLWYRKVRRGGVLAGHDYIPDGAYWFGVFGVQKAVNEFVRHRNLELFLSQEEQFPSWFLAKPLQG